MTVPANGSHLASDSDLPALRQSAEVAPAGTPVPAGTRVPGVPVPAGTAESADSTPPGVTPNLARDTWTRRAERQNRDLLVKAGFLMKLRVRHPDGGHSTVEEMLRQVAALRAEINRVIAAGSRRHRRLPRWMRWIPKYVLAFDFGLLLYFFAGITDVNWASPLSLALAFAVVLAAMVTLLSYGFLAFTGDRLRSHKNDAGTIYPEDLDGFTRVVSGLGAVIIGVLAVLMFLRMRTEVLSALGAQAQITALVIAVSVAVVSAVANFLVVAVHAFDGSDQVARLNQLSAAIRRPLKRAHRMRERAAQQVSR